MRDTVDGSHRQVLTSNFDFFGSSHLAETPESTLVVVVVVYG
jgi:hypothetical protein